MSKVTLIVGWIIGLLLTVNIALACEISFEPTEVKVDADGKANVTIKLKWEHRKCPLHKDEVSIDGDGVEIRSTTGWRKVRRGRYENTIEIFLAGKEGAVRVWRECEKKGVSEGFLKVYR